MLGPWACTTPPSSPHSVSGEWTSLLVLAGQAILQVSHLPSPSPPIQSMSGFSFSTSSQEWPLFAQFDSLHPYECYPTLWQTFPHTLEATLSVKTLMVFSTLLTWTVVALIILNELSRRDQLWCVWRVSNHISLMSSAQQGSGSKHTVAWLICIRRFSN